MAPVQLKAFLSDGSEVVLYSNLMSNSPFGMVPLRFKYESETTENSLAEGNRLMAEFEDLNPYQDMNSGKEISFDGMPTMVDGKVKFTWVLSMPLLNNFNHQICWYLFTIGNFYHSNLTTLFKVTKKIIIQRKYVFFTPENQT